MFSLKHTLSLSVGLYALWLLLSGHYTGLLLTLGAASTALTVFLALRMEVLDRESHPIELSKQLPGYWLWLLREIVISNWAVVRRILQARPDISPTVVDVPTGKRSDVGRTILANSITLTPGTVSLDVRSDTVRVHALTRAGAEHLLAGHLDRRVPDIGSET